MSFNQDLKTKKDIVTRMALLDYKCKEKGIRADILILGGAGLLAVMEDFGETFRTTSDIDIEILYTSNMNLLRKQLNQFGIEIIGGIMELPPLEEFMKDGRLYKIGSGYEALEVFVPTIELLACTKIFSKRQKDLNDLEQTNVLNHCNKEQLLTLVEEYKGDLLNPTDPDMNVHQLDRILKEKGL